jgi:TRAP-type C4-dicarboxylate transport system permease small subunit
MEKIMKIISKVELAVAAVCLVTSTSMIFLAAILRRVGNPINWSIDISLFLFAWCIFLSADIALRDDRLVSFDLISEKLPKKFNRVLCTILYVIIFAFLVLLLVYGSILAYTTRIRTFQGIPGFSYTWITLSLPVGALLMIQTVIYKIIGFYRKKEDVATSEELIFDGEDE